jgi:hypothetical protein
VTEPAPVLRGRAPAVPFPPIARLSAATTLSPPLSARDRRVSRLASCAIITALCLGLWVALVDFAAMLIDALR